MRQTEGPESEIRGCVGDAAQTVLDRVDGLMHQYVCHVKLLQEAKFEHLHQTHISSAGRKKKPATKFHFYLLLSSAFLHLPLTGVDVAIISHQRTPVSALVFKRTRMSVRKKKSPDCSYKLNAGSPRRFVSSRMTHIDRLASQAGGRGLNTPPQPPGPSAQ